MCREAEVKTLEPGYLGSLFLSCTILRKLLKFSESQFPEFETMIMVLSHIGASWRWNKRMNEKLGRF